MRGKRMEYEGHHLRYQSDCEGCFFEDKDSCPDCDMGIWIEDNPSPWHTGTPTEEGWYLFLFRTISNSLVPVTRTLKEMKDLIDTNPKAFFECFPYWQKIEIVKEKEDG